MKIIDVNLLIYVASRESLHHHKCLKWWETAFNENELIGLCWHSLVGFVRIMTNPKILPHPVPLTDCIARVDAWLNHPYSEFVREAENHWSVLKNILLETNATGKLSTDAHLAALAISRGATLVSCDTDFARFRQLRWENPLN